MALRIAALQHFAGELDVDVDGAGGIATAEDAGWGRDHTSCSWEPQSEPLEKRGDNDEREQKRLRVCAERALSGADASNIVGEHGRARKLSVSQSPRGMR